MSVPFKKNKELKRRIICFCQAQEHELIGNCTNCGKIICDQEGDGPCPFCGNAVGSDFFDDSMQIAIEHTRKLVEFDKEVTKRTRIYDDQADWFDEADNVFLTPEQREEARQAIRELEERREKEKRLIRVTLDIAEREVFTEKSTIDEENREKLMIFNDKKNEIKRSEDTSENRMNDMAHELADWLRNTTESALAVSADTYINEDNSYLNKAKSNIKEIITEENNSKIITEENNSKIITEENIENVTEKQMNRVRNMEERFELSLPDELEMAEEFTLSTHMSDDEGMCLSMLQPWASLVIAGFKRVEGRSWPTEYRGRLWIHAGHEEPSEETIDSVLLQYNNIYGSDKPSFPSDFPTGCLIGCVDIMDCFTSNEGSTQIDFHDPMGPKELTNCEFGFIFQNPWKLIIPIKMRGALKIFKLQNSFRRISHSLRKVVWVKPTGPLQNSFIITDCAERQASPVYKQASPVSSILTNKNEEADLNIYLPPQPPSDTPILPPSPPKDILYKNENQRLNDRPRMKPPIQIFDIYPETDNLNNLTVLSKFETSDNLKLLQDGIVVLEKCIGPTEQQNIVDIIRLLGYHWNCTNHKYTYTRDDVDERPTPPLPEHFKELYKSTVLKANDLLRRKHKGRSLFPDSKQADIGLANYYSIGGGLPLHQDKDESIQSIQTGFPVVTVCFGDSCDFALCNQRPDSTVKERIIRLNSGDVLLFGGPSRLVYHGVVRIIPQTGPGWLKMKPGRLSLTLRVL
eukprot:GHVL01024486.1.p1 GENE.GHVL01024486.1~~GHVL01024486.1.p1  ORF type:complete len:746 (+),score=176.80 GHVL01024486.1:3-2240(+)